MRSSTIIAAIAAGFAVVPAFAAPMMTKRASTRFEYRRQTAGDLAAIQAFAQTVNNDGTNDCDSQGIDPTTNKCIQPADGSPPQTSNFTPTENNPSPGIFTETPPGTDTTDDTQASTGDTTGADTEQDTGDGTGDGTEQDTGDGTGDGTKDPGDGSGDVPPTDPFNQYGTIDPDTLQAISDNIDSVLQNEVQPTDDDKAAIQKVFDEGLGPLDSVSIVADGVVDFYYLAVGVPLAAAGYDIFALWDLYVIGPCEFGYPGCLVPADDGSGGGKGGDGSGGDGSGGDGTDTTDH